jgi:hypothetical protein
MICTVMNVHLLSRFHLVLKAHYLIGLEIFPNLWDKSIGNFSRYGEMNFSNM